MDFCYKQNRQILLSHSHFWWAILFESEKEEEAQTDIWTDPRTHLKMRYKDDEENNQQIQKRQINSVAHCSNGVLTMCGLNPKQNKTKKNVEELWCDQCGETLPSAEHFPLNFISCSQNK